ncbi:MAG: urease accessory protein UreD [Chloroflexota bacterium]
MATPTARTATIATTELPEAPSTAPIRGQAGRLEVRAAVSGGRTRFTHVLQRPPLGISRALPADPREPRMAMAMVTSAAGGVLQGDRLEMDVRVEAGAWLVLGTQSATRFYRMPDATARLTTTLEVAADAWLEVVPDPWIPYAGAAIRSHTDARVASGGVLVLMEIVTAGRSSRGESFAFARVESHTEIAVDGLPRAADTLILAPGDRDGLLARVGPDAAVGSLFVVAPGRDPGVLADALAGATGTTSDWAGASTLPGDAGAWLRTVSRDPGAARALLLAGWAAARGALGASPPPPDRRA